MFAFQSRLSGPVHQTAQGDEAEQFGICDSSYRLDGHEASDASKRAGLRAVWLVAMIGFKPDLPCSRLDGVALHPRLPVMRYG